MERDAKLPHDTGELAAIRPGQPDLAAAPHQGVGDADRAVIDPAARQQRVQVKDAEGGGVHRAAP
ncbi:MAG: hypothetical protein M5U12_05190 [Verrucomicrobia bacterium]|nr:hypothetical protein [Verrucomicrobiota bacterium]